MLICIADSIRRLLHCAQMKAAALRDEKICIVRASASADESEGAPQIRGSMPRLSQWMDV